MMLAAVLAPYLTLALLGAQPPVEGASLSLPDAPDAPLYAAPTELDRIGRIMVPATINGRGPFRLVVDTGASHSAFSPLLAEALGITIAPEKTVLLNGVTGSAQVPAVMIDKIQAGDYVVENVLVPIIWSSIMAGADGILGVAAFKNERIAVDFECDAIEISISRGRAELWDSITVPTKRLSGGLISVDARVGGVRAKAIIDTGAEKTLGNMALRNALAARRRDDDSMGLAQIYGATRDVRTGEAFYAPKIILGDATITDVLVTFGDFHVFKVWDMVEKPVLLIGMDVLGVLDKLVIDYRLRKMLVRSREGGRYSAQRCISRRDRMTFTIEHGQLIGPVARADDSARWNSGFDLSQLLRGEMNVKRADRLTHPFAPARTDQST